MGSFKPDKAELFFRNIMESANESIFFKDTESRFIVINQICAKKFGLNDPEEAVGKSDADFFSQEHAKPAREDELEIMKTGEPVLDKLEREVFKDGKTVAWTRTSKFPLYDEEGKIKGTYGITKDVTREQEYRQKLKQSNETFRNFSEQVPGLFFQFQSQPGKGGYSLPFASDGIRGLLHLEPEELRDSIIPLMRRVNRQDLPGLIQSVRQSVRNLNTWEGEFRVELPDNGTRWVRGKAKPERLEDGTVMGYGYLTDITTEKETSQINLQLREQFEAMFNAVPNLIFVKDKEGRYQMANKAAAHYFGFERDTINGKTDLDFGIPEEKVKMYRDVDLDVLRSNEPRPITEDSSNNREGETVWHQTIKVPFQLAEKKDKAVLSIVTDITDRKRKEEELRRSMDIISEQNKSLNNFAHIVSHNLRNHAGNISMLLSLYNEEETEEERVELLSYLKEASERLNETIADLNEIVDQQSDRNAVIKNVDLGETVRKVKDILTTDIIKEQVRFKEQIEDDLTFQYNPAYLESIVLNLLSNAIKYRHPERKPVVTITARREGEHIFLEISDNGRGIDLNKHGDKIFGMYKTFHGNENSKGIGLFITRNQVESMGGSIEVKSEPDKGTTFSIKLI